MKNSVAEALKATTTRFKEHGIENARLDAEILLAHVLKWRRLNLYVDSDKILPLESVLKFNELIRRRLEGVPVAYLTGSKEFMGLSFAVNQNVLIPRPDTEILTEIVGEYLRGMGEEVTFADLGVGSGAICISILKFVKTSRAVAVDISAEALEVAKFNAEKFYVDDRLELLQGDLFEQLEGKIFNAIISNPPYIPTCELENLQIEVQKEPHTALDGGKDGLDFYRRIISDAPRFLVTGGLLAVEIGINQSSAVKKLFEQAKFKDVEIIKDLSGIDRVVFGKK